LARLQFLDTPLEGFDFFGFAILDRGSGSCRRGRGRYLAGGRGRRWRPSTPRCIAAIRIAAIATIGIAAIGSAIMPVRQSITIGAIVPIVVIIVTVSVASHPFAGVHHVPEVEGQGGDGLDK